MRAGRSLPEGRVQVVLQVRRERGGQMAEDAVVNILMTACWDRPMWNPACGPFQAYQKEGVRRW